MSQDDVFLSDALEGGVNSEDCPCTDLGPAFANEDAGALFPGSLGEADPRAVHQHGPSHGSIPSGRRLDEVQRDAIDRGFRFQSVSGIFTNWHVPAIERREVGNREAAFVDVSNLFDTRGQAGPFGIVGNKPSGLPDVQVPDLCFLHKSVEFLALGIHDVRQRELFVDPLSHMKRVGPISDGTGNRCGEVQRLLL